MANKRMFNMKICDSDAFLDMPLSTQALYFHLNMRADDDGFVGNPKRIQRTIGASEDDLKLLILKRFVLLFEDGVIVIKHWKMHNCIQSDRYHPTVYQDEMKMLYEKSNKAYTLDASKSKCIQNDSKMIPCMETKCIQNDSSDSGLDSGLDLDLEKEKDREESKKKIDYQQIADMYNETCVSFPKVTKLSENRKKAIRARLRVYTIEDFKQLFEMAEASSFLKGQNTRNWSANFDWLINDNNMAKTLDGNYADRDNKQRSDTNEQRYDARENNGREIDYARTIQEGIESGLVTEDGYFNWE